MTAEARFGELLRRFSMYCGKSSASSYLPSALDHRLVISSLASSLETESLLAVQRRSIVLKNPS
jgi:hypothetical protein